jgi:hypothetical protein
MTSDDSPVGYKRPPVHSRFQKGQSGNPGGRPKKEADFMEDAVEIIGGTVTGQAKGKPITLPMVQAMFRRLCREALKGDNPALRGVIDLRLTLEPAARDKAKATDARDAALREAARKFDRLMRGDRDKIDDAPKEPDPQEGRAGKAPRRRGEE